MKTNEFVSLDEQKVGGVGNWLLRHGAFGKTRAVQAMAKYDTELQKKVGFIKWATGLKQAFDGAVNSGQVKLSSGIAESTSNYKDFDILLEQLISEQDEISPSVWIKQFVSLYTKGQTLPSNYNSVIDNLAKKFEDEVTKNPKMKFDLDKGSVKKIYDFIYSIGLQQARDERGRIIPATPSSSSTPPEPAAPDVNQFAQNLTKMFNDFYNAKGAVNDPLVKAALIDMWEKINKIEGTEVKENKSVFKKKAIKSSHKNNVI